MSSSTDNKTLVEYETRSSNSKLHRDLRKLNPSCRFIDETIGCCNLFCLSQYISVHDRVYDLGCGQLGVLPKLLRLGISFYLGIDPVASALLEAEKRRITLLSHFHTHKKAPHVPTTVVAPLIKLVKADLNSMQMNVSNAKDKANVVLCQNVLHYLNVESIFKNLSEQLLQKGGFFIVLDIDANQMDHIYKDDAVKDNVGVKDNKDDRPNKLVTALPEWFKISNVTKETYSLSNLGLITGME